MAGPNSRARRRLFPLDASFGRLFPARCLDRKICTLPSLRPGRFCELNAARVEKSWAKPLKSSRRSACIIRVREHSTLRVCPSEHRPSEPVLHRTDFQRSSTARSTQCGAIEAHREWQTVETRHNDRVPGLRSSADLRVVFEIRFGTRIRATVLPMTSPRRRLSLDRPIEH